MFHLILCVLSALTVTLTYFCANDLSLWWIVPMFIGGYVVYTVLFLALTCVFSLFTPRKEGVRFIPFCRFYLIQFIDWLLCILGYRLKVTGTENLPDEPFLLVGNHVSNWDPMATLVALRFLPLAYVSKPQNLALPVVGGYLRGSLFLSIDREHARNAVATIRQAVSLITERHFCVGIYPEGTRSKTGELLPFRAGAFKIAKLAHCPVAIMTSRYLPRRWFLGRRTIELHIVQTLDKAAVEAQSTNELSDTARAVIEEALGK